MADKLVSSVDDTGAVRRFVDMGDGTYAERVVTSAGAPVAGAAGYPAGAVPVASSASAAAGTATATLPAALGKITYITGLQITGGGATAGTLQTASVTGALGGPYNYSVGVETGALVSNKPVIVTFNPPLPANAVNTAIVLTLPTLGAGNLASNVAIQGFQL